MLDTSALLSAHRHWLWLFAWDGLYEGFWSPFIVGEVVRVRWEMSAAKGLDPATNRQRLNDFLHAFAEVLESAPYAAHRAMARGQVPDPDDEPILAAALGASAGYVVSLNTRDFPPGGSARGVEFRTPDDFLTILEAHHPTSALRTRRARAGRQVP